LAKSGFNVLVLCAQEIQPRSPNFPGVLVVHAPIDDARPSAEEQQTIRNAATIVAGYLKEGRRVLVTCAQGRNRSAVVAAMALKMITRAPCQDVVKVIKHYRERDARGPVLCNQHFVNLLCASEVKPRALSWGDW